MLIPEHLRDENHFFRRRRRHLRDSDRRLHGSIGPASDCRRIDPVTGEVVETIPARADGLADLRAAAAQRKAAHEPTP
jgi:hypothetical protein